MDRDLHMAENAGLLLFTALAVSTLFAFVGYMVVTIRPIAGVLAVLIGFPVLWWIVGKLMEKSLEK